MITHSCSNFDSGLDKTPGHVCTNSRYKSEAGELISIFVFTFCDVFLRYTLKYHVWCMYSNVGQSWELTFHAWYVYLFNGLSVTSITITYICEWQDKPITNSIAMVDSSRTKGHHSWHFHSILATAGLSLPSTHTTDTIPSLFMITWDNSNNSGSGSR